MVWIIPVTFKNTPFWEKFKPSQAQTYIDGVRNNKFHFHTIRNIKGTDEFVILLHSKTRFQDALRDCTDELKSHGLIPTFGAIRQVSSQWADDNLSSFAKSMVQRRLHGNRDFSDVLEDMIERNNNITRAKKSTKAKPKRKTCSCKRK